MTWSSLAPHAKRQGLFLVREGVELVEVAVAVANDDQARVAGWIGDQVLRRPTPEELASWDESPVAFRAVIVQPFVLCRPLLD